MAVTPSDILHVDDGVQLTPEQSIEAKKLVESEQLRRRDPQAYLEWLEEQKRQRADMQIAQLRSVKEHTQRPAVRIEPGSTAPYDNQPSVATLNSTQPITSKPSTNQELIPFPSTADAAKTRFLPYITGGIMNTFSSPK